MEDIETKEEKLKKLFLEYLSKVRAGWNLHVDYRVHGGNIVNEVMTDFRNNRKGAVDTATEEFLKAKVKEELSEAELTQLQSFIEIELENYFTQVEQEAYKQLRDYIRERYSPSWYEGGVKKRALVPDDTTGSGIFLLTTDRPSFEKYIKIEFLEAYGPGRANKYGLTAENLPDIDNVIKEESDKLLALKEGTPPEGEELKA